MPDQLEQGLYVATLGMGIVLLSLVVLLVIVLLLDKLFRENDQPSVDQTIRQSDLHNVDRDPKSLNKPALKPLIKSDRGKSNQEVAAMAVSLYLSLEQEFDINNQNLGETRYPSFSNKWKTQSRSSLLEGQGHRPPSFSKRHSWT